jgi:hypothetical protein
MEAGVYRRGNVPHLIPGQHCSHAINAIREPERIVVTFATSPDE